MPSKKNYKNGMRFNRWTIIEAYLSKALADGKHGYARCRCDCGTIKNIVRGHLASGATKSCLACWTGWRERLLGKRLQDFVITEIEDEMVILTCTRCDRRTVRGLHYIRSNAKRYSLRCVHCDVTAGQAAQIRTGISRQAIFARLAHGWTTEEAQTIPKGQKPARFVLSPELRSRTNEPFATKEECQAHQQSLTGIGMRPRGGSRRVT